MKRIQYNEFSWEIAGNFKMGMPAGLIKIILKEKETDWCNKSLCKMNFNLQSR